jgi:hypothetical protein
MNIRIVPRRAGKRAMTAVHIGLLLNGEIIQPRFSSVGLNSLGTYTTMLLICSILQNLYILISIYLLSMWIAFLGNGTMQMWTVMLRFRDPYYLYHEGDSSPKSTPFHSCFYILRSFTGLAANYNQAR